MGTWLKRGAISLAVLAGAAVIIGGLAYAYLPRFVQQQAALAVEKQLGRKLVIEQLHINPFNLDVHAQNVTLFEGDGTTPFVQVKSVVAQVSWASLRRLAPVINQLHIEGASASIVRTGEASFNFSDIAAKLAAKPPSEPTKFALYNLSIKDGQLALDDRVTRQQHALKAVHLGVPFVSNLPHDVKVFVEPYFDAQLDGTVIKLSGKTLPFDGSHESAVRFNLDNINLVPWLAYSPIPLPFTVRSAELAALDVSVLFKQDAKTQLEVKGELTLRNLALAEKNAPPSAKSAISVVSVQLSSWTLAPLEQRLDIAALGVVGLTVAAHIDPEGALNLQKMFARQASKSTPPPAAAPAANPWQLALTRFDFKEGDVQLEDTRAQSPMSLRASQINIAAHAVQTTVAPHDLKSALYPIDAALALPGGAQTLKPMRWPAATGVPIRSTLEAQLALGKNDPSPAKLEVQAYLEPKNAVIAGVQLSGLALESLAPMLAQQGIALDLSGQAKLTAALNVSAAGEWSTPQTSLELVNLSLGLPQSSSPLRVQKTSVQLKNSTLWPRSALNLTAALGFADAAYAKLAGSVRLPADSGQGVAGALKVDVSRLDALPLVALVPQALSALNVRPSSGFVSALGEVVLKGNAVQWAGNVALDQVQVQDADAQDLLKLGKLSANGMRVDTGAQPMALHLGAITLQDGFAKLLLSAQGKLNVTGLLKPPAASAAPPSPSPALAPALSLDGMTLVNTAIDFSDNFIQPNYRTNISQLTGSIGAMSASNPQPAEVVLKGSIEGSGELSINGKLNPLSSTLYTDISAKATGIELTQLSPYSAKYADYNIVKGKLSAQVNYFIDQGQLKASNKIKIDQLTFGDNKIGSADATKLPVKLAVALLKDRKGVIEVDLPISGSLSDPSFSVGSLIWQVLGNLVVKAVTSPFALLGSLFGGGETLSYLDFAPGSVALDAAGKTKLDALAKALNDRPALKLDITGRADAATDTEGLRQAWLNAQLRNAKFKALLKQNKSIQTDQVSLLAGDEATYLPAAYADASFSKPRNMVGLSKSLPAADMQKLMLTHAPINADAVQLLASQRANAVQAYLQTVVDKEQLFLVQADASATAPKGAKPSRVDFALK